MALKKGGGHRFDAPRSEIKNYSAHAQPTHSHDSQLQTSTSQSGHLQTTQPQLVAFAETGVVVRAARQHCLSDVVDTVVAFWQPQASHPHSTQVQYPPWQSGHRQPVQSHADLALAAGTVCPVNPNAYIDPRTRVINTARAEKRFITPFLQFDSVTILNA